MSKILTKLTRLISERKEWKRMEARAHALPRDYRVVYGEMKSYLWRFTAGDGMDIVVTLNDVLVEFETAAGQNTPVLEVTGDDVAAYCDAHLVGAKPYDRYVDKWRTSLNHDVKKHL
jgi:DNA-binding ferritin-like protein (Dps family)